MANETQQGEPIYFYEFDAPSNEHLRFDGVVRVVLDNHRNGTQHLRITDPDAPSGFRNINSVKNEEQWDSKYDRNTSGEDYWERADEGWTP